MGRLDPRPVRRLGSTAASSRACAPFVGGCRSARRGGGPTLTAPSSTSSRIAWHTSSTGRFVLRTRSRTLRRPSSATTSCQRSRSTSDLLDAELVGEPDPALERRDHGLDLTPLLDQPGELVERALEVDRLGARHGGSSGPNRNEPSSAARPRSRRRRAGPAARRVDERRRPRRSTRPRSSGRRRCR